VSDLERLFQQLVANLTADPGRLRQPLPVGEIIRDILPYRANRRALGIESAEDYEVLLLRLCAGDGGFAHTSPPEIEARFQSELAGSNPDLSLLRTHGDALVFLNGLAVARALASDPDAPYVPPSPAPEPRWEDAAMPAAALEEPGDDPAFGGAPAGEPPAGEPDQAGAPDVTMCVYCGGALPAGRPVNFCPHCGQSQTTLRCPACQSEVEYGWRHCVNCGAPLGDG
jgi:predicted RNA-binding Zn-ribbon protein involved in translation (DUF1610 family)